MQPLAAAALTLFLGINSLDFEREGAVNRDTLFIMLPIFPSEAESLLNTVYATGCKLSAPRLRSSLEQEILNVLSTPEEALFYTEAPTAIADASPRLRPHVKSVRIRSAEVYDFYYNSARTVIAENISLRPRHFSRHLTKTLADSRNISHSFMNPGVRESRANAARMEEEQLQALQAQWPKDMKIKTVLRIVNPAFPFLITAPDGVVFHSGKPVGLIEIKSSRGSATGNTEVPMIRRQRDGQWRVVRDCRAWFQIQTSLAITGMEWCMLVSYSSRDNVTYRVKVSQDEGAITSILLDMHRLYYNHVVTIDHASLTSKP